MQYEIEIARREKPSFHRKNSREEKNTRSATQVFIESSEKPSLLNLLIPFFVSYTI